MLWPRYAVWSHLAAAAAVVLCSNYYCCIIGPRGVCSIVNCILCKTELHVLHKLVLSSWT